MIDDSLPISDKRQEVIKRARKVLSGGDAYEFTSLLLRFVDDVEFWFDPADPENFDWPDEQQRRRYARRMERRARGEVIDEDAEFEEDVKAIEAEEANPR